MNNEKLKGGKTESKAKNIMSYVSTGLLAGFFNGLFGGGGGMIVVPMLTMLLKKNVKKAHATAILIILPISLISGLIYSSYQKIEFLPFLSVSLSVVLGGVLGAFLLNKLPKKVISIIFSCLMAFAGLKMLIF